MKKKRLGVRALWALALWTFFGISAQPVFADKTESDLQLWAPVTFKAELPHKFQASVQLQTRYGENISELSRFIVEPELGYDFNEHVSVDAGFSYEKEYNAPGKEVEKKLYQEIWLRKPLGNHNTYARAKLEEFTDTKGDTPLRTRIRIGDVYPIGQTNWHIVAEDELFVNVNSVAERWKAGVAQNRIFVGVGRDFLNEHLRVQIGYLLQHTSKQFEKPEYLNHCIYIRTSYHLQGRGRRFIRKLLDI